MYPTEYKWTQAETVQTTTNIVVVNESTLMLQSTIKLPDVNQLYKKIIFVSSEFKYLKNNNQENTEVMPNKTVVII
tara:strand:- start:301 stop:528 length:228 start_codon:yes stop_codon:yes gene_type:complete